MAKSSFLAEVTFNLEHIHSIVITAEFEQRSAGWA